MQLEKIYHTYLFHSDKNIHVDMVGTKTIHLQQLCFLRGSTAQQGILGKLPNQD